MELQIIMHLIFIGISGDISYTKKSKLPYTCAFVQELYRFRTVAPLVVAHKAIENTEIGKWKIPKGTKVS